MDEEKGIVSGREEAEALLRRPDGSIADDDEEESDLELDLSEEDETHILDVVSPPRRHNYRLWLCMTLNVLSTIAIVFTNKHILSHASLRRAQITFAAFHFTVTGLLLYGLSRPSIAVFEAKALNVWKVMPIAVAMMLNVVLQNAALSQSSIQFAQLARILLTPGCVLLNYVLYRKTITPNAALALIPICFGVGVVSYYEPHSGSNSTTPLGVIFTFSAVTASVVYTVLVKPYHEKLDCTSTQLLLNQSVLSVGMMIYIIPITDDLHFWEGVDLFTWMLVGLSGVLAAIINLTMIMVIHEAGPVTSTVVGHFKNCSIVLLGWITSHRMLKDASIVGFITAVGGIVAYSYVTRPQKRDHRDESYEMRPAK